MKLKTHINNYFKLKENGTTVRTEITAGLTTFMAMAYILAVNPMILSACGMEYSKVFTATAIVSFIATMLMGLVAKLPFALSTGMGMNTLFSYTVCLGMGYSWRWALTAILFEGIIFIILSLLNIREAIVNSIPDPLKKAIGAGVGFFIAYVGLKNAGIIVSSESDLTTLNPHWYSGSSGVAMLGILITSLLVIRKVKGGLLFGMIITAIIGIPFGITAFAGGSFIPDTPYMFQFAFEEVFSSGKSITDFLAITFTFLFLDLFDTMGCIIACAGKCGMIQQDGSIRNIKQAFLADSIGTTCGALFGTSTVTTFAESSVGVSAGGRTGLTSITTGVMFLLAMFLEPVFASIPSAATTPALIMVGVMMITDIRTVDFTDMKEAIPVFVTIITMLCASNISDGIMFGILFYVIFDLFTDRGKNLRKATWAITILFAIRIIITILSN